jgi:hypothetical protein
MARILLNSKMPMRKRKKTKDVRGLSAEVLLLWKRHLVTKTGAWRNPPHKEKQEIVKKMKALLELYMLTDLERIEEQKKNSNAVCICRDTSCCSLCGTFSCDCGPNCGLTWNMTHPCPVHKRVPEGADYHKPVVIPNAD